MRKTQSLSLSTAKIEHLGVCFPNFFGDKPSDKTRLLHIQQFRQSKILLIRGKIVVVFKFCNSTVGFKRCPEKVRMINYETKSS